MKNSNCNKNINRARKKIKGNIKSTVKPSLGLFMEADKPRFNKNV